MNPRDPRNVIVSFQQSIGEGSDHYPDLRLDGHVAWSGDGGKTWTVGIRPGEERFRKWFDASVTFDLHGHAFVAYLVMDNVSMTDREGQLVRRSLDGGRTWEAPITLVEHPPNHEPLLDHFPNIVADNSPKSPRAGTIYVVWDRIVEIGKSAELRFVRSIDDGKTWSQPKVIGTHPGALAHSTVIGHDGTIYLMIALFGPSGTEILVEASHDGGETWDAPIPVTRTDAAPCDLAAFPRAGGWPTMAIDPRGGPDRLFVVWGDCRNGDRDLFSITSDNGGRDWTSPVPVNAPEPKGREQAMQWLAVDPTDGAAYVVFYDRPGGATPGLPTVTLARSADGGRTYRSYRWNARTSDPKAATLGDYIGVAASDGRVYAAWTESVAGDGRMKAPRQFKIDTSTASDTDWPYGPSAVRVGIADFRGVTAAPLIRIGIADFPVSAGAGAPGSVSATRAQAPARLALLEDWNHQRKHILAVIDSATPQMLDFRTTPGVRSFAEQIYHIISVAALITSRGVLGQPLPERLAADTAEVLHDQAKLRAQAEEHLSYVIGSLEGLTEERLVTEQSFAGGSMPRWRWNMTALQHSAWTLGQLVPYLRMNGRTPPQFTPF